MNIKDLLDTALQEVIFSPSLVYSLTTIKTYDSVANYFTPSIELLKEDKLTLLDEKTRNLLYDSVSTRLDFDVKEGYLHKDCVFHILLRTVDDMYFQIKSLCYDSDLDRPATLMPRNSFPFLKTGEVIISEVTKSEFEQAVKLLGDEMKVVDSIEYLNLSLPLVGGIYLLNDRTYDYFRCKFYMLEKIEKDYKSIFSKALKLQSELKLATELANYNFRNELGNKGKGGIGGFKNE